MTAGPSPWASYAILVPSVDVTVFMTFSP